MSLSTFSIANLVQGDVGCLPVQLQVMGISHLAETINGKSLARLTLSDGHAYHRGFVVDSTILIDLAINVNAMVSIEELDVLHGPTKKQVLEIKRMRLLSNVPDNIGETQASVAIANGFISPTLSDPAAFTQTNYVSSLDSLSSFNDTEQERKLVAELLAIDSKKGRIEGRVVWKSPIHNYNNGLGRFFAFDFADLTGVIRCKAFNGAANRFINVVHEGQVYRLENFILNHANKQYNRLEHDFEINLIEDSVVTPIQCDTYADVHLVFKITKLSSISVTDNGKCFDVFVKLIQVDGLELVFVPKKNRHVYKRMIMVSDDSDLAKVVLWGEQGEYFAAERNQMMMIKDSLVQNFNGHIQFTSTMTTIIRLKENDLI